MATYAEAVNESHRKPSTKKVLDHLRVHEAENGGHIVEHHFEYNGAHHEPESHVFSEGEGHEMLAHIAKHLGVKAEAKAEGESEKHEAAEHEE